MTNKILLVLSLSTVLVACNGVEENKAQFKTPGNVLTLNAAGCVATTSDGKPFVLPASAAGTDVLIPKGTRMTAECFTTALAK